MTIINRYIHIKGSGISKNSLAYKGILNPKNLKTIGIKRILFYF